MFRRSVAVVSGSEAVAAFLLLAVPSALLVPIGSALAAETDGSFKVTCTYSHSVRDDPIALPGQPGASHQHDFFGNKSTSADSTYESMTGETTTCRLQDDTGGYWVPTPILEGAPVSLRELNIEYNTAGAEAVETMPAGLRLVGGDEAAEGPPPKRQLHWSCGRGQGGSTPTSTHPYDCTAYAAQFAFVDGVVVTVELPRCWNGLGLDPSDVAYPPRGSADECPPDFPHVLPKVTVRLHLRVMDPCLGAIPCGPEDLDANVKLAFTGGPYYRFHVSFWNTWQQETLDELVADCLNSHLRCGSIRSNALFLFKEGPGSGTVTSQPAGIACGTSCSHAYREGTSVTLSASPGDGSTFVSWAGACSGTSPTCTVTMDASKGVTARFGREYLPDGSIRVADSSIGRDVYDPTGLDQAITATVGGGSTITYFVQVQNDGAFPDSFTIDGAGGGEGFVATYLEGQTGTTDITDEVEGGTYTVADVAPGEGRVFRLAVTISETVEPGTEISWTLVTTSAARPSAQDTVRARVALPPPRESTRRCLGRRPTIRGTKGNDIIRGTDKRDIIQGGRGDDIILAGGRRDIVCGGPGDDGIHGGSGGDVLDGGLGSDFMNGADGDDRLIGGFGLDALYGAANADTLLGEAGNDYMHGGGGRDVLDGGTNDDQLVGAAEESFSDGEGVDICLGGGTCELSTQNGPCPASWAVRIGVWRPVRLSVQDPCRVIEGTVRGVQQEEIGDGDLHFGVQYQDQEGTQRLVVEFMPRDHGIYVKPEVGQPIVVQGAFVFDVPHGDFVEIHPAFQVIYEGVTYRSGPQFGGNPVPSAFYCWRSDGRVCGRWNA